MDGCTQPIALSYLANVVTHTHTHPFNGPLSGTTWVSRYQNGRTNLDFTEARDSVVNVVSKKKRFKEKNKKLGMSV